MNLLPVYIPKRIIIIGLCFLGAVVSYADRANMSIAIASMALEFNWSYITQGYILSSFFIGNLTTQVIGGALSDRFGGKWVLGIAAALWTIFTLLTPIAAKYSVMYLILCRILLGIGEGACFPSIHSLIAVWFPPEERSRAVGAITSSPYVGIMVAMPISTLLIASPFFGWERASNPIDYPGISKEELSWILKSEYDVNKNNLGFSQFESRMSILEDIDSEIESSRIIAIEEDENTRLLKVNHAQKYLKVGNVSNETLETSNLNINKLGYFSVVPYVLQGTMGFVVGIIGDYLVNKLNIRVITVRRGAQIIEILGKTIFLLFAVYLATTPIEGIILITIGYTLGSFTCIGVQMSQLDIAPKFAGVIWGLGNTFGVIAGYFGVALVGLILDITAKNWNIVWNLVALSFLTGSVLFVLWVGDEVVIS
ncbi:major facilitator superfamily domain-containing protein [Gigaspora rosea]|uniref:Major facilitator superfamily domain-containing protein n=1 Tax=Gigaspora rosea TaxID=44941 RepID=A0A397V8I7_9GLOM|nr:major facilitator superfamily domain-containing protein [Gigaspora rosea]